MLHPNTPSDRVRVYISLLRVTHYVKNLFILAPLFFAGQLLSFPQLVNSLIAFVSFSLVSSAIYIVNDIFDIREDRRHPVKKGRPLPSGAVSLRAGVILAVTLGIAGAGFSLLTGTGIIRLVIFYVVLNVLYSSALKRIAILHTCPK